MTYDSWKARELWLYDESHRPESDEDGPIVEVRVPTEQDVLFAQMGYDTTDKAWNDLIHHQFGGQYYAVRHSSVARGTIGSELRKAWDANELAKDHYLSVWNDYMGHRLRDFP